VDVIRDLAAVGDADIGLNIALNHTRHGVVAVGLGGAEHLYEAGLAREAFAAAIAGGLHATVHAGEGAGPESVWAALEIGAERIGHAVSAVQDFHLLQDLKERAIPLELNPTSNVRTGVCPSFAAHPLRRLFDQGLLVTVNSDDPAFFGSDLAGEYLLAHTEQGFTRRELRQLARNSIRASFLPAPEKSAWLARIDSIR